MPYNFYFFIFLFQIVRFESFFSVYLFHCVRKCTTVLCTVCTMKWSAVNKYQLLYDVYCQSCDNSTLSPHELNLLCSAWVGHCHRLLVEVVEVVDLCASRLARLICSQIILTASSPGNLLICRLLTIRLRDLPPLPSSRVRSGVSC